MLLWKQCQIEPHPMWMPQERWVWEHACTGKTANFNSADGYGGNLDPKKPEGWPTNRILQPAFIKMILLHEPYRSALHYHGLDIEGARFTEPLDLSHATLMHPLWLDNSRFESDVDLSYLRTPYLLSLQGSTFTRPLSMNSMQIGSHFFMRRAEFAAVDLRETHIRGQLDMAEATFTGALLMNPVQVDSGLLMPKAKFTKAVATVEKEEQAVNLRGARIGRQLDMSGVTIARPLYMDSLDVGKDLFMRERATFTEVVLRNAHVGSQLSMIGTTFTDKLDMNGIQVGGSLLMRAEQGLTTTLAEVVLRGAHIKGQLDMSGATVNGVLHMDGLIVDHQLFMSKRAKFKRVMLQYAHIKGMLDMSDSTFSGSPSGGDVDDPLLTLEETKFAVVLVGTRIQGLLNMAGSTFTHDVSLRGATIEHGLFMNPAEFIGRLTMDQLRVSGMLSMSNSKFAEIVLAGADIGGQLDMSGATLTGSVDLDAVGVARDLFMNGLMIKTPIFIRLPFAKIGTNLEISGRMLPSIDLASTRINGELRLGHGDPPTKWQEGAKLILRNTEAELLYISDAWPGEVQLTGLTYNVLAEANATRHVTWFAEWLAMQQHYSPQPYEQLAGTLRKAGYGDKAKKILYANKAREHSEAGGLSWAWLTLQWMFIGYGYYNFRALLWMLGLWLVGMCALNLSKPAQSDINLHYGGCAYSLDMLLPIIAMRKKHNDIELNGWVRVYFYFHRMMGYVLTFFLVAGLSGLTK